MTGREIVSDFISQKKLAVVGVSRKKEKFGNLVFKELKKKGYSVFPVNPHMDSIEGQQCFKGLRELPEPVDGAVIVVPPGQTEQVVQDASAAGISRVWMQQGSESDTAVSFCRQNNIREIHGECILMFAEPVGSFHRFHRWLWGLLGKLPK